MMGNEQAGGLPILDFTAKIFQDVLRILNLSCEQSPQSSLLGVGELTSLHPQLDTTLRHLTPMLDEANDRYRDLDSLNRSRLSITAHDTTVRSEAICTNWKTSLS